ncbi:hypothetical protein CAXC1_350019 [Candidatus Xenohaliotis californiensis]|uniref:Uncharacterized protein n=1 Tax=Candidatus Xenohaliotis californiensis TaxID=84677 RepID=A0ABM9N8Y2_9RICK|nr:hypothetical protein CAXC1_350019 [Candidatus Xenohaliotis californiensis]
MRDKNSIIIEQNGNVIKVILYTNHTETVSINTTSFSAIDEMTLVIDQEGGAYVVSIAQNIRKLKKRKILDPSFEERFESVGIVRDALSNKLIQYKFFIYSSNNKIYAFKANNSAINISSAPEISLNHLYPFSKRLIGFENNIIHVLESGRTNLMLRVYDFNNQERKTLDALIEGGSEVEEGILKANLISSIKRSNGQIMVSYLYPKNSNSRTLHLNVCRVMISPDCKTSDTEIINTGNNLIIKSIEKPNNDIAIIIGNDSDGVLYEFVLNKKIIKVELSTQGADKLKKFIQNCRIYSDCAAIFPEYLPWSSTVSTTKQEVTLVKTVPALLQAQQFLQPKHQLFQQLSRRSH